MTPFGPINKDMFVVAHKLRHGLMRNVLRILWRLSWGFSNKKRDDCVEGSQILPKVWRRHLWTTPCQTIFPSTQQQPDAKEMASKDCSSAIFSFSEYLRRVWDKNRKKDLKEILGKINERINGEKFEGNFTRLRIIVNHYKSVVLKLGVATLLRVAKCP